MKTKVLMLFAAFAVLHFWHSPQRAVAQPACFDDAVLNIDYQGDGQYRFWVSTEYTDEIDYSWTIDQFTYDAPDTIFEFYYYPAPNTPVTVGVVMSDPSLQCPDKTLSDEFTPPYDCSQLWVSSSGGQYTETSLDVSFYVSGVDFSAEDQFVWKIGGEEKAQGYDQIYPSEGIFNVMKTLDFVESGIYEVCLGYNSANSGCYIERCDYYVVGEVDCSAAFTASVDGWYYSFTPLWYDPNAPQAINYTWTFGDGKDTTVSESGGWAGHAYGESGSYTVCLTVEYPNKNCSDYSCQDVSVSSGDCGAEFGFYETEEPGKYQFYNTSQGNNLYYWWDFGDGAGWSSAKDTVYTYIYEGVFPVTLYVWDDLGCYSMATDYVYHGENLFYNNFSYSPDAIDPNKVYFYTDLVEGNYYYWDFGNGTYSEEANPVVSFSQAGVYDVCLYVSTDPTATGSGTTSSFCQAVYVGDGGCNVQAEFRASVDQAAKTIAVKDLSRGNAAYTEWYISAVDTPVINTPDYTTAPLPDGKYWIQLTVANEDWSCWDFAYEEVVVGEAECQAIFDATVVKDKDGNYIMQLKNLSKGGTNFYWNFGNWNDWETNYADVHTPAPYAYTEPGEYLVSLFIDATAQGGWCWDYAEKWVTVGEIQCAVDFGTINLGDNAVQFIPETKGDVLQYEWHLGNGTVSYDMQPVANFPTEGYYYAEVITSGLNGCIAYNGKLILVGGQGNDMEADFSYTVGTPGGDGSVSVRFADNSKGNYTNSYWYFGDASADGFAEDESSPSYTYSEGGFYDVCLLIYNDITWMQNITCKSIAVNPKAEDCKASFVFRVDKEEKTVTFKNTSINATSFTWYFGDGTESNDVSPEKQFNAFDFYDAFLVASNASGCESYYYDILNLTDNTGLYAGFRYEEGETNLKAAGYPVDFLGAAFGNPAKVSWDFGDGTKDSTSLNPTHVYSAPGTYTACLTVEDPNTGEISAPSCQTVTVGGGGNAVLQPDAAVSNLVCFPNPAQALVSVSFGLTTESDVEVSLCNALGQRVLLIDRSHRTTGSHLVQWDSRQMPVGVYLLRLQTARGVTVRPVVIAR